VGAAGLTDNAASALCYVLGFITGIIFLVLEPYSKNRAIRFHAFQSIFLCVALIIFRWVLSIILYSILGLFSMWSLLSLISLAFFALWIYMILMAYQGKKIVLPVIGPLAEKQA